MPEKEAAKARTNQRLNRELDAYSTAARTALIVEEERQRTPDHRLAIYSGVAGAALAGAFTAEAAIVYKAVDMTLNGATGATDVQTLTFSGTNNATFTFFHRDNVGGVDRGSLYATAGRFATTTGLSVYRFTKGQTIQAPGSGGWTNTTYRLFRGTDADTGQPAAGGQFWNGHTGYIGVRYNPGDG